MAASSDGERRPATVPHLSGSNEMSRVNCDAARRITLSPQAAYLSPQMRKTAFSRGPARAHVRAPGHTQGRGGSRTLTLIRQPADAEHLSRRLTRTRAHPQTSCAEEEVESLLLCRCFLFFSSHANVTRTPLI